MALNAMNRCLPAHRLTQCNAVPARARMQRQESCFEESAW